jgi:MoaE-MoaD fusion protein
MQIQVLYFAAARERAGTAKETIELPEGSNVGAALDELGRRHPPLAALVPHLRVAVNQEFAARSDLVPEGCELALIPPVAGGALGLFRIVDREPRLEEVVAAVGGLGQGGLVTFSGVVRDQTRGKRVVRLEYEAYPAMAEKKLAEVGAEAEAKWPGARLAIVHRTGTLIPGQVAVVIAASAPHRKEAFRACEHAIDRLKEDVPIWKKELYEDGEVWVGLGP